MEEKLNKTRSTCWTYKKWKFASLLINFVLCLTIKYIVFVCHGIVRWCSQKVLSCNKLRFHWEMSKHSACVCKCQGETYRLCDDFYHYSLLAKSIRNTSVHTEWSNFHQIIHHCCKKCPFIDSLFPCFTRHSDPVKRSKRIVVTRVPLSIASIDKATYTDGQVNKLLLSSVFSRWSGLGEASSTRNCLDWHR